MNNRKEYKHVKTFENEQYVLLNAWAIPKEYIASHLGITVPTLYKYYKEEMQRSNACIVEKAVESAVDLLHERDSKMTDRILSRIGNLKESETNNNINISLNTFVDKPKELELDEWLKVYSSKPQEIESIDAEIIED